MQRILLVAYLTLTTWSLSWSQVCANFYNDDIYRWSNATVLYRIAMDNFTELASLGGVEKVKAAISEIENNTCVRFIELTDEDGNPKQHWVRIYEETNYTYPEGLNCMSMPGSVARGQPLMLGRDCLDNSMILHELMHTLGFIHEHQRPDRDQYILINTDNVPDYLFSEFEILNGVNTSTKPFDFESVLLYGPYDGSVNGQPVLTRKDGKRLLTRTEKIGLSESDILLINRYYECQDV